MISSRQSACTKTMKWKVDLMHECTQNDDVGGDCNFFFLIQTSVLLHCHCISLFSLDFSHFHNNNIIFHHHHIIIHPYTSSITQHPFLFCVIPIVKASFPIKKGKKTKTKTAVQKLFNVGVSQWKVFSLERKR